MQRLVPQEYAERLREAGGQMTAERRLVTILFSDVKGSTAMAEALDPEEVMEIMNGAFEVLIEPVVKYEGTLARLMGDAVLAFFGAPISHEDDPERAIRAGLEIVAGAKEYAARLKEERGIGGFNVRVGINTGLVVVGEVGSDLRVEYTAMGDAINLAARMEQHAPLGGVLITHDTYRHVRGVFSLEAQAPLAVKGVAEPVSTYLVSRAKPRAFRIATRGVEGIETPMVGREAELKSLQDALYAAVEDGEGQIITVMGEAGVGKSRLLYEFTNWIDLLPQEVRFFQGRARQDAQNQPYALLRDMFSSRFLIQDGDSAGEIQQKIEAGFGEVFGQDESGQMRAHFIAQLLGFDFSGSPYLESVLKDAQQLRDRSLIYLDEYFQGMSESEPTVIFLEDIHWADDSSLDVINQLARKTPHRRILIVCLARPVIFERRPHWGEGLDYHHRLGIKPLTKRDSRLLVDEILQRVEQLPVELRDLVVKGAEGNPFYIEELIKMLLEDGVIVKDEEHWRVEMHRLAEVDVPTTLTGVLQARLDGLPQGERALLQQASVVGRIFWDRVLQHMIEQEAGSIPGERIEENLISLRGRELIFHRESSTFAGADEYIFKHALLRDVTYESVLKRLRRVFHSLVAEWLIDQGDEYPGLIADHLEQAREVEDAVKYLREAGDQAAGRYANAEAVQFYTRAIQLAERVSPDVVSLAGLHRGRGLAHGTVGEFDQARADFEAALHFAHTAGEYQEEWRVLLDLGKLWASRDYNKTRDYFERALELARRMDDQAVLADSLNWIGNWYANDENPIRAVECHQEALRIFKGLGNQRNLANTLDLLGIEHLLSGDLTASAEFYDQAIALFRELNDRSRLISSLMGRATIVSLLVLLASVPPALPLDAQRGFEEAIRIAQEIDSAPDVAWAHWSRGLLYTVQGQFGPALDVIQDGIHIASEIGHREWEVGNRFALGVLYGELFAPEFARQQLEKALNLAQELQSRYWVHHVTGALAAAYYLLDDQSLAQTCLEKVLSPQTPMDTMGKRYCWARRAELALAQGDPALALEITDRLITSAPGILKGQVITFLWMLKGNALAAIGLSDEACSLLHAARENAQATGERFLLCRIQARLERLSCFTENGREAEEELPTARMLIEELATTIPDEALKKNFLQGALKTLRPLQ
jgi:class 3 adenylate cyclase/tetratricopeptide (TPR) repeat protein